MKNAQQNSGQVLVVGGGPVGLSAALELARFSIPSVLIEQRESITEHPKTRIINARTVEIARGWGPAVYRRLHGIDVPQEWKSPVRFLRSAVGEELGRIDSEGFAGPGPDVTPAPAILSSQELLERVLVDAAAASPHVTLRFGHRVDSLLRGASPGDRDAAVAVTDVQTGETSEVSGSALVAADGVDSTIRRELQIDLEGHQGVSHFINCYFRADIERHVADRPGILFFVANPGAMGVLQPLDARGRWLCQIAVSPEEWDVAAFGADRLTSWIRAAVGVDDIDPEILSVGRWRMNATVAERLGQGRVVLCGDAAHQFPPTGGMGVNTGIQGMHNAIWKLAYVVTGHAGEGLLRTYDDERRPVAQWAAEQSLRNHTDAQTIAAAALGGTETPMDAGQIAVAARRYGNHLGVEFGSVYDSAAVVPDGTEAPQVRDAFSDYAPSARPGCRAPHVWLGRNGAPLSTVDLVGLGFTVLAGDGGHEWVSAVNDACAASGVPIAGYRIGDAGLDDRDGLFYARYGLGSDGAVLIRPDGYVAWRSAGGSTTAVADLSAALAVVLHRAPDADEPAAPLTCATQRTGVS